MDGRAGYKDLFALHEVDMEVLVVGSTIYRGFVRPVMKLPYSMNTDDPEDLDSAVSFHGALDHPPFRTNRLCTHPASYSNKKLISGSLNTQRQSRI